MKILALDTSGTVASVAVWEDDLIRVEYSMNDKKTHSQTILPMLEEAKNILELDMDTLDAIAIAAGPGSFTGLRIGSATAKGLAYALQKPIIPIPTVDSIAYNMYGTDYIVCPILDARRNQVYTGLYEFTMEDSTYIMKVIKKQCVVLIEEIMNECNKIGRKVVFLGDGVPVFGEVIQRKMQVPFLLAPAHMNRQRAASVASRAAEICRENMKKNEGILTLEKGVVETAQEHAPEYLRLSQAERERLEKEGA